MGIFDKKEDGVDPLAELRTKVDGAATKADVSGLETKVTGALSEMKTLLEGLRPKEPVADPNSPDNDPAVQSLLDPAKFVRDQMKPFTDSQAATQAAMQEMRARQNPKWAPYFSKFGDALVQSAQAFPIENRGADGFWAWHIMTFTGGKVVSGELKTEYPQLLGTSTVGVGEGGNVKDPNMGMNPAVAKWLTDHNVPLEGAARAAHLIDKGEQVTIESYKNVQLGNA